jgi:hypothetical protein
MRFFVLVVLNSLIAQSASAGWLVTYKEVDSGNQSYEYFADSKAKYWSESDGMINTGEHLILVNGGSRAYWKGTAEQYCDALKAWTKRIQAQMATLSPQFKPVPISQRKVTRKKLGNRSIAGFSATGYEFSVDGVQEEQIWVSSDASLSGVIGHMQSQSKKVECLEEMDSSSLEVSKLYKQTIKDRIILDDAYKQVVSVEEKTISASQFDAPEGYKAFHDYDQFVEYSSNHSGSSSMSSADSPEPQFDMPERDSSRMIEQEPSKDNGDNVVVNDAEEIASDAVKEAHQSTKQGISEGISEDIQKGVRGLMDKLGF